jgi:GNAT superfamily N-acetyltransferase
VSAIRISLAKRSHLAELPKIELAAATMFSEADLPRNLRYKVTHVSYLQEAIDHGCLWVALHENKPVGFASASVIDGAGYLDEVDVSPEFARQGIGTRLVSAVVDWARSERFPCLMLITFRHLAWNAPFYERLGFRKMDSKEHGRELAGLIKKERRIGLDVSKRVAMRLDL